MGVPHGNPYGVLASFPINVIKTNTLTKVDQGENDLLQFKFKDTVRNGTKSCSRSPKLLVI